MADFKRFKPRRGTTTEINSAISSGLIEVNEFIYDVTQQKFFMFNGTSLVPHKHTEADIVDLNKYTQSQVDAFLSNKADVDHTHTPSDIIGLGALALLDEIDANTLTGLGVLAFEDAITNSTVAENAEIAWDKISKIGAEAGDVNAADVEHTHGVADITDIDNYTSLQNTYIIKSISDLPTPSGDNIILEEDASYIFSGNIVSPYTLLVGESTLLMGNNPNTDSITYSGNGVSIKFNNVNSFIQKLRISAPTGTAIEWNSDGTHYLTVENIAVIDSSKGGSITGGSMISFNNCSVSNNDSGLYFDGNIEEIRLNKNYFIGDISDTEPFISFNENLSADFVTISENSFYNLGGIAIDSQNNSILYANLGGNKFKGVDFPTTPSADFEAWNFYNNLGI